MNSIRKFVAILAAGVAFHAQAADPVQVLILGTYHFANPGLDMANVKVDDVLQPARQAQLQALTDGLLKFKPTKVAVERNADKDAGHTVPAYRQYLAGVDTNNRNEIVQIGFRLAKQARHAEVFGIDVAGAFPFEDVQAFAATNGQGDALAAELNALQARVKQMEEQQKTMTISAMLRSMNDPSTIKTDNGFYMRVLSYGKGEKQPGAVLAGSWATRNFGICARLAQIAQPGDRIVVVYGAGHNHALRQCVQDMPGWQLAEANSYLP